MFGEQPFRSGQPVILEKRTAGGTLDLRGEPQPPLSLPGKCPCCTGMTLDDVYTLFFRDQPGVASAGWTELKAWLDERGWKLRAKTW